MKTISIKLADGKYEFRDDGTGLKCYLDGECWRVFIGDHAVTELFLRCAELEMAKQVYFDKQPKEPWDK